MATIEQPPVISEPEQVVETNGRWIGYARLLQMRMLELWREPEVIFWVFVFPLLLPSLRERTEDIPALVGHFAAQVAALLPHLSRCIYGASKHETTEDTRGRFSADHTRWRPPPEPRDTDSERTAIQGGRFNRPPCRVLHDDAMAEHGTQRQGYGETVFRLVAFGG